MFSTEIDNRWPTSGAPAAAPPPPAEGVCNYYVTRKRRYCKMLVKTGARSVQSGQIHQYKFTNRRDVVLCSYCGEHLTCDSERVPCPYDPGTGCAIIIPWLLHISWPGHTCSASSVDKHLQVCNSRPPDIQPGYLVHGVNMGPLPSRWCRLMANKFS